MTFTETAFVSAIYALYLSDCLYWIGPAEQAWRRASATEWQPTKIEPLSFTLAARRPVLADPFLLRPGVLRLPLTVAPAPRDLRKLGHRLDRLYLLLTLCRAQAFLLLVYLPALLVLHRLVAVWPLFLGFLLIVHIALSTVAIRALRRANPAAWRTAATSLALNPLGATRCFDILTSAFFDQPQAPKP